MARDDGDCRSVLAMTVKEVSAMTVKEVSAITGKGLSGMSGNGKMMAGIVGQG